MIRFRKTRDTVSPMLRRLTASFSPGGRKKLYEKIGMEFRDRTWANMGATGTDRPFPWRKLTKRYARRVKRDYATLIVSGRLRASIGVHGSDSGAIVYSTSEYAAPHQYGSTKQNIPARPYFPVNGITPTARFDRANRELVGRHAKVS